MADVLRFQDAPRQYDVRDQVEMRRALLVVVQQMQQEIADLRARVVALEPVVP